MDAVLVNSYDFFFYLVSVSILDFKTLKIFSECVYMGVGHGCATLYMWKPEDNLKELVLTFHHVESKDGTQISSLAVTFFARPLIHLARLQEPF